MRCRGGSCEDAKGATSGVGLDIAPFYVGRVPYALIMCLDRASLFALGRRGFVLLIVKAFSRGRLWESLCVFATEGGIHLGQFLLDGLDTTCIGGVCAEDVCALATPFACGHLLPESHGT